MKIINKIKSGLKKIKNYVKRNKTKCFINAISLSVLFVLNPWLGFVCLALIYCDIKYDIKINDMKKNYERLLNENAH